MQLAGMTGDQTRELELLAPARNISIGTAAIDCGADAVYIAGPQFGARQAAGNDIKDISTLCSYAHRFGARIFITLNTILFDSETGEARRQLEEIQEAGADAVIVQDLAVLQIAKDIWTQGGTHSALPLHASTQCAIRTPEQARFYEDLGFSRLILERELSLEQIHAIRQAVSCELEFFVHGALCVCYSGQCYMSEAISGRSANRGACIQACRSLYDIVDSEGKTLVKDKAVLSLKDFNLIDRIADLADAGITSFKIEGRLKNISYVRNTVRAYSMALDNLTGDSRGIYRRASYGSVKGGFTPALDKTFNRGYTSLFIDGKRGSWSTYDSAKGMGEEIGTVSYISKGKDMFRIKPSAGAADSGQLRLNNGDGLSFVSRSSKVTGFRADICTGMDVKCKPVPELYIGARIFRNIDTAFEKELAGNLPERMISVSMDIDIKCSGQAYSVTVSATTEDGRKIARTFDGGASKAENTERMEAVFRSQLSKASGIYRFSLGDISFKKDSGLPFLQASFLNSIRRTIASGLDDVPCIRRPMENRTVSLCEAGLPGSSAHAESGIDYKSNISNRIAGQIYSRAGAVSAEPAYELTHRPGIELMRTKYCIRYELGICPAMTGKPVRNKLYLENNRKRFSLVFDCAKCEMAIVEDTPLSRK